MVKKSEKKKKKQDDAPADGGQNDSPSATEGGRKPPEPLQIHGDADDMKALEEAFDTPGYTPAEAKNTLEELMREAEELDAETYETLSPEEREALEDRFEERGTLEDAKRIIEDALKTEENAEAGEESAPSEGIRFEQISEELGVSPEDVTVSVKVDGEKEEKTLQEALNGYIRESTFTKRMQGLSEEYQQVEQLGEQLAGELEAVAVTIGNNLAPEQQQALVQRYQEVTNALHQRHEQARQEKAAQERERLRESMGWEKDADWEMARTQLQNYATEQLGFSPEVLSQVADHRAFEILEKARRFDQEQGGGKRKAKKTLKPGQGRSRRSRSNVSDARKRVARSGSMSDAADALEGILFD